MPWSEMSPMDQRTQFIADCLRASLNVTELCELYGVSRKTGYKWIDRYLRQGPILLTMCPIAHAVNAMPCGYNDEGRYYQQQNKDWPGHACMCNTSEHGND